ncbi:hypothetical protein V9T40_006057 [Parthenolecanium corni]|uniref:Peptidase C1A papain C-terminal domain-containing protein n=1 Tax=Parthenolecanium corni TaxID=536013 RepID=A0AAN9TV83_9HEMI
MTRDALLDAEDVIASAGDTEITIREVAGHNSITGSQGYKRCNCVYYSEYCQKNPKARLNHALLAVGFGTTDEGEDYWLIKNSWGTGWGDNGFFKIARNKNSHCGIADHSNYPIA